MYYAFMWIVLWISAILIAIFHIRTYKYNRENKNIIIASLKKDTWPYWILWSIWLFLFLILFFAYKPIIVPSVDYVDYIKISTKDNHLEQSLWVSVCDLKKDIDKFSCTEDEELYWCDDNPDCETCSWYICGVLDIIISGWTLLPASWIDFIRTMDAWQTGMVFEVYQWEEIVAMKNTVLQSWILITWLPEKKAGEAWVYVSFDVDKKWHLSFRIVDKDNKYNSTEWTVLIPNNGYVVVPEWNISAFEYLKWRFGMFLD